MEAEKPAIFVYPQLLSLGAGSRRRGGGGRTGLRARQQAFVNGPQLPGCPRRADSHWLDTVVPSAAVARQEEAFFWTKNNARVSPGTSLLHPLPSIVSHYTIPGRLALHSGEGGGMGPGEISNVQRHLQACPRFPLSGQSQGSGGSMWTDRPSMCHWFPVLCKGLPAW